MTAKNITLNKIGKRFLATILTIAMIVGTITIQSSNNVISAEEKASTDGYVIENTSSDAINVVIKHMLEKKEIYSADNKEVTGYGKVNNYKKAVSYDVKSVEVTTGGKTQTLSNSSEWSKIKVAGNATVNVNYTPINKDNTGNSVAFYDYDVMPKNNELNGSINRNDNYDKNDPNAKNGRFTVGQESQNYGEWIDQWGFTRTDYSSNILYKGGSDSNRDSAKNSSGQYINRYCGYQSTTSSDLSTIVTGIVKGLDEQGNVEFNFSEPGVYSNTPSIGKIVYNNGEYGLNFKQNGDTYTLTSVQNNQTNAITAKTVAGGGKEHKFLPLPRVTNETAGGATGGDNFFFGMRYDVEFKLGDYIGDLKYEFAGDDDMWVLLDGKVVLDLGGVHSKATRKIDLWNILGNNPDREATHRLTVLYMERGAYQSNCEMKFTLPNARVVDVSAAPKADITINKVSSEDNNVLSGAQFTLTNDENSDDTITYTTNANGEVTFTNLVKGTYTLTEISAPDGYQVTDATYKVIVTNNTDGTLATAKLYKADGVTEIANKTIVNTPNKEVIEDTLDYEKTAKLANSENAWDKREYDITINAKSKKSSTTTFTKAIDVAMVFDLSGSMNGKIDGSKFSTSTSNFKNNDLKLVGYYSNIISNLDKNKIYYRSNDVLELNENTTNGFRIYPRYPMKYIDGQWMYCDLNSNNITWKKVDGNNMVYTWDSRISALKEASSNFVSGLAEKSETSKISIDGFRNTSLVNINNLQVASTNESVMLKSINKMEAWRGTYPSYGLNQAYNRLKADTTIENKNKYVILFSDGAPSDSNATSSAETSAKNLRNAGYTVMCVLLGNVNENVPGSSKKAGAWLRDEIASDKKLYTATTAEGLNDIFNDLQGELVQPEDYKGVTVVDTISKEFKLTDDQKLAINNSLNVSYVENEDGTTTVTWINQTVGYSEKDWTWTKTIRVVAKDEYIGGNNVSTNVPGENSSYIEIPELGKVVLQEPKVNVKLDYVVNNHNEVFFKGETFTNSEEVIKKLFDANAVTNSKGTVITMYDASAFATQLYKADSNGNITEEMASNDESFTTNDARYLKVTYSVPQAGTSATTNTDGHVAEEDDSNIKTGKLGIEFVAGRLAITKTINAQYTSKDTAAKTKATQTFVFKIDQYTDASKNTKVRTFYETITFNANEDDTTKTKYISELEKGYYVVTEETSWSSKYSIKNDKDKVQIFDIGTVIDTDDDGTKTFSGLDDNSECKYTELAKGEAARFNFENSLKSWIKWYSDAASAKNKFNK